MNNDPAMRAVNDNKSFCMGFLRRRTCVTPTWRGWLLLVFIFMAVSIMAVRNAYFFLAPTDPIPGEGGMLVVEGWGPDWMMADAIHEFQTGRYDGLCATGGPIEKGEMFAEYKTYAELSAASILKMGIDPKLVHAIPAFAVKRDRTYASAMALKKWLRDHGVKPGRINLVSGGAHSRRSRLLYEYVFGKDPKIGIIALPDPDEEIDPRKWWTTSAGFRAVTGEMIAYVYARFLFKIPNEE